MKAEIVYILIMVISSYGRHTATLQVEFKDQAACEYARKDITKNFIPGTDGRVHSGCYPKKTAEVTK